MFCTFIQYVTMALTRVYCAIWLKYFLCKMMIILYHQTFARQLRRYVWISAHIAHFVFCVWYYCVFFFISLAFFFCVLMYYMHDFDIK